MPRMCRGARFGRYAGGTHEATGMKQGAGGAFPNETKKCGVFNVLNQENRGFSTKEHDMYAKC